MGFSPWFSLLALPLTLTAISFRLPSQPVHGTALIPDGEVRLQVDGGPGYMLVGFMPRRRGLFNS